MQVQNPTKKQHYVPQVYLRGFSQDEKCVYSFDLKTELPTQPIPIESVCRENYLYEIKDGNNDFIYMNLMENILCGLEGRFADYRRRLKNKAFIKSNYKTRCFLTNQEKDFWKVFITTQMLRSPLVLGVAEQFTGEYFGDSLNENNARAIAIAQCLPFFRELSPNDNNVFIRMLSPLEDMTMAVGVDESGSIFTSDNPVYCYAPNYTNSVYEKIIFPICKSLVLILFGGAEKEQYDKNRLIRLEKEEIINIKKSIAYAAQTRLFSACSFSTDDIKIIKEARKDKQTDLQ